MHTVITVDNLSGIDRVALCNTLACDNVRVTKWIRLDDIDVSELESVENVIDEDTDVILVSDSNNSWVDYAELDALRETLSIIGIHTTDISYTPMTDLEGV